VIRDGYIYGVCANGELRCCDVKTGEQLWETFDPVGDKKTDCGTAFLIPRGDRGHRFFLFNDSGDLILANLTPKGYEEFDRARIVEPVEAARGRKVVWAHPAFAGRCVFARNNKELVCVSMAASKLDAEASKSPTPRPRPRVDPKPADLEARAVAVIKQVAELHKGARAMHADAELETTVTEGKGERKIEIKAAIDLKRPNHFALRARNAKDPAGGLELVCDGKTLFTHMRRLKQYTEAKAPADLADIGQTLPNFGHTTTGMLFQNVLTEEPEDLLLEGATACTYVGREKLGEAAADHVKVKQADLEWEVWVAAEGKPFVLKVISRTGGEEAKVVTVETYRNWKVDHKLDEAVFKFDPPADAKKVKSFK
jgi:hypothetical protein